VLRIAEFTLLVSRLLLAAVFLLAGAAKLVDPVGSRRALRDFGVPSALARPMVLLLPLLELAVAVALIPARLAWYGARGALALLTVFMIAVGIAMIRGRKPDCHCFGQLHSAPAGWPTLIRNGVLAVFAGWLASRGERDLGPDPWAWFASLGVHERKVALVAACVAGFVFLRLLYRSRPESESIASQLPQAADNEEAEEEPEERPAAAPGNRTRTRTARPAEFPAPAGRSAMGIGLPIGTSAPEFELPGMTGEKRSLQSLRKQGRDVLLVFSSPFCKPCQALASSLVRWKREMEGLPNIVLVSRGTARDNLAKLNEFEASQVLLQRNFEVAEAYDCISTPTAVLVGADGLIRSDLAVGGVAIKQLLASCSKRGHPQKTKHAVGNPSVPF
jgi:peroxiredoxin